MISASGAYCIITFSIVGRNIDFSEMNDYLGIPEGKIWKSRADEVRANKDNKTIKNRAWLLETASTYVTNHILDEFVNPLVKRLHTNKGRLMDYGNTHEVEFSLLCTINVNGDIHEQRGHYSISVDTIRMLGEINCDFGIYILHNEGG